MAVLSPGPLEQVIGLVERADLPERERAAVLLANALDPVARRHTIEALWQLRANGELSDEQLSTALVTFVGRGAVEQYIRELEGDAEPVDLTHLLDNPDGRPTLEVVNDVLEQWLLILAAAQRRGDRQGLLAIKLRTPHRLVADAAQAMLDGRQPSGPVASVVSTALRAVGVDLRSGTPSWLHPDGRPVGLSPPTSCDELVHALVGAPGAPPLPPILGRGANFN